MKRLAVFVWALMAAGVASAHEVRPAYLELVEKAGGEVDVLWKTPMVGEMRLALWPRLSGAAEEIEAVATRRTGGAAIQSWRLRLDGPLRGHTVAVDGLTGTMTDALVRVELVDGAAWTARLTPSSPEATIPERPGSSRVVTTYTRLGVEHILGGFDHLLFVLALVLLVQGGRRLVATITAFTAAHSVTLTAATLGLVKVPVAPVEATIALSIAFVAAEVVATNRGAPGLTARKPWLVAFTFGLLHGLGFASALAEVGLPQGAIPLALACFNVGVEAGQLLFVAAVLAYIGLARRFQLALPRWAEPAPAYAIGSVAMFWVLERVARF